MGDAGWSVTGADAGGVVVVGVSVAAGGSVDVGEVAGCRVEKWEGGGQKGVTREAGVGSGGGTGEYGMTGAAGMKRGCSK